MRIRRVVTGHSEGRSVFVSDEEVEPVTTALNPGVEFHRLWGADETPTFPDQGALPAPVTYFPPLGGYRFGFFTLPPGEMKLPEDLDLSAAVQELEQVLPGMLSHLEPADPGMHTTDTIDFEVVVSGRVILELDDGAEKVIGPGETVVQNGTRHRWRNPGPDPVVIAVFMVGARRSPGA